MRLFIILGVVIVIGAVFLGIVKWSGGSSTSTADYQIGDPAAPKLEVTEKNFDLCKMSLTDVGKH